MAKSIIGHLLAKYNILRGKQKVNTYNEAQTRNEFIEPLFEALGWDMRNLNSENEVTTEEAVSAGRVDLSFRINSIPVMFVEAKSMKVDLDEWKWAEQAINYSWNKSVSWAILTDFEAIKIFNSEIPPTGITENLFIELKCSEYIDRFDQLWLLSKESFLKQSLSIEAERWGKTTKRKSVSEKLFEDLTTWRSMLTASIQKRNPSLVSEEIDESVQRVLDRLIFIRTAEDRKIDEITLQPLLRRGDVFGGRLHIELTKIFREYDKNYNSKLFDRHASEQYIVDDKVLLSILSGLYKTKDGFRYDFSLISSDVLGGIYEEYLGRVLEKSKHRLVVAEDFKKKRKHGIYYTPQYVVNYILHNTLGLRLQTSKLKEAKDIRILDPASGSGSFLIAAFDLLIEDRNALKQADLFAKFEILKENIYGVDLDAQAVEISQLNLLLKALIKKELLPSLQHNIRVGNSLLEEGPHNLRPFAFAENFKEVFAKEGFDVIVGNPPYIKEFTNKDAFNGLHESPYYQGKMDIWTMFACRAIDMLKAGGLLGFIAPNNWVTNAGASILRKKILTEGEILTYVDFGDYKIFKKAGIQTMIFTFQKKKPRDSYKVKYAKIVDKNVAEMEIARLLHSGLDYQSARIRSYSAVISPHKLIGKNIVFSDQENSRLLKKIESKMDFKFRNDEIAQGIIGDPDDAFVFGINEEYTAEEKKVLFEFHTSVGMYMQGDVRGYIAYLDSSVKSIENMPNIKKQLEKHKHQLLDRREVKTKRLEYFNLHWPRDRRYFEKGKKIVCAIRTEKPAFYFTEDRYFGSRALNFLMTSRIDMKYLTGVLNSKLVFYWLKSRGKQLGSLLQVDKGPLLGIPIVQPSKNAAETIDRMVDSLTTLHSDLSKYSKNTDRYSGICAEIRELNQAIDRVVYGVYKLDESDIKTIDDYLK